MQQNFSVMPSHLLVDPNPISVDVSKGLEISAEGMDRFLGRLPTDAELKALEKVRVVKLTEIVNGRIAGYNLGRVSGYAILHDQHTTTLLAVNEYEPRLLEDVVWRLIKDVPTGEYFGHDDFIARTEFRQDGVEERHNGWAHSLVYFKPRGIILEMQKGKLQLGRWQDVIFIDLDTKPIQQRYLRLQLMYGKQ
jgi:thiamine phosphate synthase YjbQ (UPF0047 family)